MAQIRQLMEQLSLRLMQEGMPCYPEYPKAPLAFHEDAMFAVVSSEKLELHTPIYTADAVIVPAAASFSVRFLQSPESKAANENLQNRVTSDLLPAAFSLGWQITGLTADAIRYEKQIDRLCLEVHMTVQTLITMQQTLEEVAADAV